MMSQSGSAIVSSEMASQSSTLLSCRQDRLGSEGAGALAHHALTDHVLDFSASALSIATALTCACLNALQPRAPVH
jgi:hypothetical protein